MDCRFSCLIFPFYANKFPISGFEKTAAYSTICSRIVSVKPVFSRKMCWFQRKNVPISSHFCGFPQTFRRLSTVFSTICGKTEIARNFGNFSGYRKSFPTSFPRKSDFLFQQFQHADFWKIFAVRFSSSFPQNFQQVFLFNSTIFQLFKMSNADSTFQHKFNNCTVKKKVSRFAIFLTFPPFQQSLLLLLIFLIFLFYQNDTHRTANTIATVETFHNF